MKHIINYLFTLRYVSIVCLSLSSSICNSSLFLIGVWFDCACCECGIDDCVCVCDSCLVSGACVSSFSWIRVTCASGACISSFSWICVTCVRVVHSVVCFSSIVLVCVDVVCHDSNPD